MYELNKEFQAGNYTCKIVAYRENAKNKIWYIDYTYPEDHREDDELSIIKVYQNKFTKEFNDNSAMRVCKKKDLVKVIDKYGGSWNSYVKDGFMSRLFEDLQGLEDFLD